jgi:Flp pilus assembly protein protease CpaA
MLSPPSLPAAGQALLGMLAITAAASDIRFRIIPNWLVLAGIFSGVAWNVLSSGWPGLGSSVAGFGLGLHCISPSIGFGRVALAT